MSSKITSGGKPIQTSLWEYFDKPQVIKPLPSPGQKGLQEYIGRFTTLPISQLKRHIQRDTEVRNLKKITRRGINGDSWQAPRVVYVKSTKQLLVYDGDHSLHLWLQLQLEKYPDAAEVVVEYREVDAIEEYHQLFVDFNLEGRTGISAEVAYVHRYYAGYQQQADLADCMRAAGVYVYGSVESGGRVGDPQGCKIKVNSAKKCALYASGRKSGDPTSADVPNSGMYFRPAVDIYRSLPSFKQTKDQLKSELVGALVQLVRAYPAVLNASVHYGDFRLWFHNKLAMSEINHEVSKWKIAGGSVHNKAEYSIAKGIVLDLQGNPKFKGITTTKLDKLFA